MDTGDATQRRTQEIQPLKLKTPGIWPTSLWQQGACPTPPGKQEMWWLPLWKIGEPAALERGGVVEEAVLEPGGAVEEVTRETAGAAEQLVP